MAFDALEDLLQSLTTRQHEVALCVLEGDTNRQIAAFLGLHRTSVERHVAAVLRAFGVRRKADLRGFGAANDNHVVVPRIWSGTAAGF